MDEGSAIDWLPVGIDVAAENFVAAWLAPGGQPGAPFTGEQTPTGIGLVTAAWPPVGAHNCAPAATPAAASADAGLAPVPHESGRTVRARPSIGHVGNARPRTALSMASCSAAQHHPAIKRCYDRLHAVGKPMKVALRRRPQVAPPRLGPRYQAPALRPAETITTRGPRRPGHLTVHTLSARRQRGRSGRCQGTGGTGCGDSITNRLTAEPHSRYSAAHHGSPHDAHISPAALP
jgi:hypothetical protein